MNVILELLLVYMLYRFIAGFLIPVYRASRQMRRQFHDMNGRPPAGGSGPASPNPNSNGTSAANNKAANAEPTSKVGEYIDFEEIK